MQEAKSRFDEPSSFGGSSYTSPGWQRAQAKAGFGGAAAPSDRFSRKPAIEGEGRLVATSDPGATASAYTRGDRVFHQKFGPGRVSGVEGNKLTVEFDHAGEKRVLDSFVARG
jgi:DNA helicase-2/ATP-dependent DNA helicase PcrA